MKNKLFLYVFFIFSIAFKSYAQTGQTVKIDGKLDDWHSADFTYNKATKLYYGIANDENNLYLAIKSTNKANNYKINGGGIGICINYKNIASEKGAPLLIFPNINVAAMRGIMIQQFTLLKSKNHKVTPDEVSQMRKNMIANAKEIKLVNFPNITDSLISIYNRYGIKTAITYDNDGNLCYELSIPFKQLNITPADHKEFFYELKVNPIKNGLFAGSEGFADGPLAGTDGFGGSSGFGSDGGSGTSVSDMTSLRSATNFWSKYKIK